MGSLPAPVTTAGRAGLEALLTRPADSVLALDFDGTLAPIVPDPADARVHPEVLPALAGLAPLLRAVVVITGRPSRTAVDYGGFAGMPGLEGLTVLGAYGAERWDASSGQHRTPPPHPGIDAVRAELPDLLGRLKVPEGTWTEDKGHAIAVHTRRTAEPARTFERISEPIGDLAARHELHLEPGRFVLEIRPSGVDKGDSLRDFLVEVSAGPVLYAGDDLGDLAAYDAVEARRAAGEPGLLVCSTDPAERVDALTERADLTVEGPAGIAQLLTALLSAMTARAV